MISRGGRYVITYNGEVYNFPELRKELEGREHRFRGHSDTEVILAAIEEWGLEAATRRFVGMFAFGLWDRDEQRLHLVRDRLGIKPLYYGWTRGTFLFASEMKSFRAHPLWSGEIDRGALALFMRHNHVPGPRSIHTGCYKLFPGCILTLSASDAARPDDFSALPVSEGASRCRLQPQAYWTIRKVAEDAAARPFEGSEDEAVEQLEELLREAVACRMVSDVPLGAFLSGGIDSSTVVSLMQSTGARVKTFTIGFHDDIYNEAHHASAVAHHLGTEHTELYVSPEDSLAVIPELPTIYDEPFSDASQIPTFLVSQLARRQVTVSLSGDGGDESFAGYNRYLHATALWRKARWLPFPLRRLVEKSMVGISVETWDRSFRALGKLLPAELGRRVPGDTVYKSAEIIGSRTPEMAYHRLTSNWQRPEDIVLDASEPPTVFTDPSRRSRLPSFARRMMQTDLISYLPDDILVKVDRASMGVSLEARLPLLDHRVVEFAARLPLPMLIRGRTGKHLLRRVLYRHVPRELIERPKAGFGVPLGPWLRGSLREWAEELLNESRLRREGYLDPAPIRRKWQEHLSGKRDWKYQLWNVLMFEAWLEKHPGS